MTKLVVQFAAFFKQRIFIGTFPPICVCVRMIILKLSVCWMFWILFWYVKQEHHDKPLTIQTWAIRIFFSSVLITIIYMLVLILWEHRRWPKHRHAAHDCTLCHGLAVNNPNVRGETWTWTKGEYFHCLHPALPRKPSDVISKSWDDSRFHATPTHQSTCHSQWKERREVNQPIRNEAFSFWGSFITAPSGPKANI